MAHGHHITPFRTLLQTFLALIALTVITVAASQVHLGPLNVPIAIAIAAVKASIVAAFFMALKYDNKVNFLVLVIGLVMVVVFITFTLFDTAFRGDIENVDSRTIDEIQRTEEALNARPGPGAGADALPAN